MRRAAEKLNLYLTLFSWTLLGGLAAYTMWQTAMNKAIVIEETNRAEILKETEDMTREQPLTLLERKEEKNSLCIPLDKGISAEQVMLENHYMEQELWIDLQDAQTDYYAEHAVYGDTGCVREGRIKGQERQATLVFRMDQIYEYRSVMDNGLLRISFGRPGEMYGRVIVLEPLGRSAQERELTGRVAATAADSLKQEDIKIYVAEAAGGEEDREAGQRLAQQTEADIYIAVDVSTAEDAGQYGIQSFYNDAFFIPGFGNVELADALTRNVTVAVKNRALGLVPDREDAALEKLNIPAARLCIGFMSNEKERSLLLQESYQDRVAQGIAAAIKEVITTQYEE